MKKMLTLLPLIFMLFGCAKTQNLTPTNIEVVEHPLTERKIITGTIENTTSKKISSLQIHFNFHNRDGKIIGTAHDYLDSLEPQETWVFRAGVRVANFNDVYEIDCVEATGVSR